MSLRIKRAALMALVKVLDKVLRWLFYTDELMELEARYGPYRAEVPNEDD